MKSSAPSGPNRGMGKQALTCCRLALPAAQLAGSLAVLADGCSTRTPARLAFAAAAADAANRGLRLLLLHRSETEAGQMRLARRAVE